MNYYDMVCKCFDFFYQKIYNTHFNLDLSINNQRKQVENFIKVVAGHYQIPSIGINFIVEYFFFAFAYWKDMNTKRPITLNWIIGKKMFDRWFNRTSQQMYYVKKFSLQYDIDLNQLKQSLSEDCNDDHNNTAEELEKSRFTGQARLYNCLHNTTLYNHLSTACMGCICSKACKELLFQSNPTLYHHRGYTV